MSDTADDLPPLQPELERFQTKEGHEMIRGVERGMIFWGEVLKAEARGAEQYHPGDTPCPWVVLSSDKVHRRLPIVVAAPLTTKVHKDQDAYFRLYRIRIPLQLLNRYKLRSGETGLNTESLVLLEQTRAMAHVRLIGNPIAYVDGRMLAGLEAGAKEALAFE